MAPWHNVIMRRRSRSLPVPLICLSLLLSGIAPWATPAAAGEWITDPAAACAVWNPAPVAGETVTYEGQCENGLAHGAGRIRWYQGGKLTSIYKGEYRAGRMHGHGVFLFPDGSRYEGEFRSGHRHGYGVRVWPSGNRFEGEFRRGKRHGHGIMDYADGMRYEGPYANGKPHGPGGCYTPARGQWRCSWENGKLME